MLVNPHQECLCITIWGTIVPDMYIEVYVLTWCIATAYTYPPLYVTGSRWSINLAVPKCTEKVIKQWRWSEYVPTARTNSEVVEIRPLEPTSLKCTFARTAQILCLSKHLFPICNFSICLFVKCEVRLFSKVSGRLAWNNHRRIQSQLGSRHSFVKVD